ncbi:hypothetical protein [Bacillus gaemokensis]|uniref:Uncharacterized protein n=1 Tax=Bacillus gaemokensis TaxID=574375 RepID=A0A073KGA0_9BACI|nr:hypothetical protein [Bacillus gaemokensis]KEK25437.1 hypothetical protein BAGA_12535 [Bacillus gaemokensis]KYG37119.1 hypothetical protein AZF08_06840 [Bacillus gaemokensis]
MTIFLSEVETFCLCSATVVEKNCTFDFVVRSTPIGISICLVENSYEEEWLPVKIETYLKVNAGMFPDEEAKEDFRKQLNSETGWMLDKQGENAGSLVQRAMRISEYEAFQTVEKNIPRKMRKDLTDISLEDESNQVPTSLFGKRPSHLM